MTPRDGFMGRKADGIPLKEGFLRQNEAGFTLMQLSKGLRHDVFGATTALQLDGGDDGSPILKVTGRLYFTLTKESP